MIDLLKIAEIMDDVRLNNDCGLVSNILNLKKDGIEVGYECGSLKISRHITYLELDYLYYQGTLLRVFVRICYFHYLLRLIPMLKLI
jgi:hypothetical protein